mmetsp:Transcript_25092/g.45416  ORF Transcript_25092/g.45416 Transcript_25092/m.45416 type:complete len:453 (-) Transcript_25092:77-1435(-)
MASSVSASGWIKGISFSILASVVGGGSKLAIRKSWLIEEEDASSGYEAGGIATENIDPVVEPVVELVDHRDVAQHGSSQRRQKRDVATYSSACPDCHSDEGHSSGDESDSDGNSDAIFQERRRVPSALLDTEELFRKKRRQQMAYALRLGGMIGMTFLNPLCCVVAMNYASPSILAPFSGLTLVWIVLFAEMMIGERPRRTQVGAAGLIVLGEVVISVFGDHSNDENSTLDNVTESYKDPAFVLYFVGIFLWMVGVAYMMIFTSSPTLRRFSWGVSGGSITGLQNFLKDFLTIMKVCDQEVLSYPWYFYIMLLSAIASSFSGLLLLTACMKRYDATFSAAMFVGSFVISASIMSAVHYHTFQDLDHVYNIILYPLGLCILMTGVIVLAVDRADSTTCTNVCEEDELQSQGSKHESVHKMVMDTISPARERMGSTETRMKEPLVRIATSEGIV